MRKKQLQKGKRAMAWLLAVSMFMGSDAVNTAVFAQEQIIEVTDSEIEGTVLNASGDVILSDSDDVVSSSGLEILPQAELSSGETSLLGVEGIELIEEGEPEGASESAAEDKSSWENVSESNQNTAEESSDQDAVVSDFESDLSVSDSEQDVITVETELDLTAEEPELDVITAETELSEEITEGEFIFITEESDMQEQLYAMAGEAAEGSLQARINDFSIEETGSIILDKDYKETLVIPEGKVVELDLNGYTIKPDTSIRADESADMSTISVYGTLVISDSTGNGGIANPEGAASIRGIHVGKSGKVTMNSGSITGFASSGSGGAVKVEKNGTFVMNGGSITGNKADGDGAGIYAYDGKDIQINAGVISGNEAAGSGGGIGAYQASAGELSFDNAALQITGNKAGANGGGVWVKKSAVSVVIGSGTYTGNSAGEYGGAFSFDGTVSSCQITGVIQNNTAKRGGGIRIGAGSNTAVLGNAKILQNTASLSGGGLHMEGAQATPGTFTMTSGRIGENKIENSDPSVFTSGAGMYFGPYITAEFGGTVQIDQNTEATNGGGICISSSCTVTINEGCIIENNSTGGAYNRGTGGGIYMAVGTLTMNGGVIRSNSVANAYGNGGGIYSDAVFILNGGEISGNSTNNDGGGICCGTARIYGGLITENKAGYGAGIRCGGEMTGGTITKNTATGNGGGVGINGTFTMTGGEISENKAGFQGGGAYGGTLKLAGDAEIINNTAGHSGGGFLGGIQMTGGVVSGNRSGYGGGGVCISGSSSLSGGVICENTGSYGGGVYVYQDYTKLTVTGNVEITENTAVNAGGGLYIDHGSAEMDGGIIHNNTANYSGGIHVNQLAKTFTLSGGLVCDNLASVYAGGMDISVGQKYNANTDAPSASIQKASAFTVGEGCTGVCWYEEVSQTEVTEDIVFTDPDRWTIYRYTFRYNMTDAVAAVGTELYPSVQAAVDALAGNPNRQVITMLRDSRECVVIPASAGSETGTEEENGSTDSTGGVGGSTNIVLDLAGHTLQGSGGSTILIEKEATVTICDSSADDTGVGTGKIRGGTGEKRGDRPTESYTYGGGLYVKGTAELESGVITDNTASYGSGVYVSGTGSFTMTGGAIQSNRNNGVFVNRSDGNGGVFYLKGGTVSGHSDNAVRLENSAAKFFMEGGAITNNIGSSRGVYLQSGQMVMTGGSISGNKNTNRSLDGGGIYLDSYASSFIMEGGTIENNYCSRNGGGMYVLRGTVILKGGTIQGNTAENYGGGIYVEFGSLVMEAGTVTGNTAVQKNGGGIQNVNGSLTVNGGKIYGNKCGRTAQDILSAAGKNLKLAAAASMGLSAYNCWFDAASEADHVYITEALEETAAAHTYQLTAYWCDDPSEFIARIGNTQYVSIQDAVNAAEAGDTIHLIADCTDKAVIVADKDITLNLNGYTLSSDTENAFYVHGSLTIQDQKDSEKDDYKADSTGGVLTLAEGCEAGRGVYVTGSGHFTLESGTVCGFKGSKYGGAVLATNGGSVTIKSGVFRENQAEYGGAVCLYPSDTNTAMSFTMTGGTFTENTADYGGALDVYAASTNKEMHVLIENGTFSDNTAKYGGAINVDVQNSRNIGHTFRIHGSTFTGNKADTGAGGAVWYLGAGTSGTNYGLAEVELVDTDFIGNEAKGYSGGVYISSVKSVLIRNILAENNTGASCGGIHCALNGTEGANTVIDSATIRGNTAATGNCGGAWFSGNVTIHHITVENNKSKGWNSYGGGMGLSGNVTIEAGRIAGNSAHYAGGINANCTSFVMGKDVTVQGNTAYLSDGGGMYLSGGGTYDLSGTVTENRSLNCGGGITANCSGTVVLKDILIKDNQATVHGGGFYAGNSIKAEVTDQAVITGNKAGQGGGISLGGSSSILLISGGTISGNTAGSGGGIRVRQGTIEMTGGKISENTSSGVGGGITVAVEWYDGGNRSHIKMTGGEISENTGTNGGGIYNDENCEDTVISGGVIRNNTATGYGGGVYNRSCRSVFSLLSGGQIYDNKAGRGQDVFTAYSLQNHKDGKDSYLNLIKASDMFTEADNKEGIGWLDENTNRVTEDAIVYNPVLKERALTLAYRTTNVVAKIGTTEYTTVQDAVDAIKNGVHDDPDSGEAPVILLVADARENVTVPGSVNAVLNLNGHTLQGLTTAITAYGDLVIRDEATEDSPGEGTGTITGNSYTLGGGIHVRAGGYVKLESGQISGCNASRANTQSIEYGGAGVYAEYGTFEMTGGSINNCRASCGAAVYVKNGASTFKMSGGTITGNTNYCGGSVIVRGGLFQMTGGTICENTASNSGAGVYIDSGRALLYGGEIADNQAKWYGGGVYMNSGTLRLRGVTIARNYVTAAIESNINFLYGSGGGIYLNNGYCYIYDGTTITENTARRGGGIYQSNGTALMVGGVITKNTADRGGGVAQFFNRGCYFTLSMGQIYGNTSSEITGGNDIYSAYEGTGDYSLVKKEDKPKMTLIPALEMGHEDYNVWQDDKYEGDALETEIVDNGKYVVATIVESNNLQLTASWYGDQEKDEYTTRMRVQSFRIEDTMGNDGVKDGTAEFDVSAAAKEKTAKDMLDAGQATESTETYVLNDGDMPLKKILYKGKLYEREQAVEWSAGDDSSAQNDIVRTYDSVIYKLTSTIGKTKETPESDSAGTDGETPESSSAGTDGSGDDADLQPDAEGTLTDEDTFKEPETLRLWLYAEIPCSAEEAEFSGHGLDYYYTDEVIRDGETVLVLRGYWEIANDGDGGTIEKTIAVQIKGMKNKDTLKPVFKEWLEGNPEDEKAPKVSSARMLTISAAPRYNVTLQRNTDLAYTSYFDLSAGTEASKEDVEAYEAAVAENRETDPNIVHGTMLGYGVTLSLYNDRSEDRSAQNLKGIELPEGPIDFDLTLSGSLYMNGRPITDENGDPVSAIPVVWAYKENINTSYGSDINNTLFNFEMNWNDEDDIYLTTQYAYNAAPFNSGGGDGACYSGGIWHAESGESDIDTENRRMTMHFTVDGYSFDSGSGPSKTSDGNANILFSPAQIKAFSAGYVQIIYPVDMKAVNAYQDRENISVGYVEINMEGMVSSLDAESATGQEPISTATKGMDVMQEYFGDNYPEYATDEMNYVDNYSKDTSGLYNFRGGPGSGDGLVKTNYYNKEDNTALSGSGGTGSTPLGSNVYISANVKFLSREFDTTVEGSAHYNSKFDAQVDNRLEYNYMTAMNLLQKFDADAYTPVTGTPAIVNQRYEPRGSSCSISNGAFVISTDETATSWSQKMPYKTQSYTLTVLYAAKPDGSNWIKNETNPDGSTWLGAEGEAKHDDGGVPDMDKYTEENLIYFTTLQELYNYFGYDEEGNPKGNCVAILYQFRDCCIRTQRSISVHSKMDVTNVFEQTGNTYATTNDARCWSTYRPTYKSHYADKTLSDVIQNFNWAYGDTARIYGSLNGVTAYGLGSKDFSVPVEGRVEEYDVEGYDAVELTPEEGGVGVRQLTELYFNGYIKTQYDNGSKVNGTHNGWYSGNTLLVYTMQSSVFIENTDLVRGGNGIRNDYNISGGDRTASFRIVPKIQISSGVKDNELVLNGSQSTEVTITVTIPKHLYYTEGSAEFNYAESGCQYAEGDLSWSIEKTVNEDGTTTLVFKTYVSDINKGLPSIKYGCAIGTPENPETDIAEGTSTLITKVKINTTYEETNRITCAANTDQTSIRVIRDNNDFITKTAESSLVELGDDLVYKLSYSNYTEVYTSIEMMDILPYNGDGRLTSFSGGYRLTGVEITFYDRQSYDSFVSETGGGSLKIKNDKTENGIKNPGNLEHTAQKELLNEARAAVNSTDADGWKVFSPIRTSFTPSGDTEGETVMDGVGTVVYDLSDADIYQYAADKTAIAMFCSMPLITGEKAVSVKVILSPLEKGTNKLITSNKTKQEGDDIYWNNFFYRSGNATPVVSGEVFIRTVDRTISGLTWMDQNQDGIYTIGSGNFVSSDRLLKGISVSLYTNTKAALDAAVEKKVIAANEDGTWSSLNEKGEADKTYTAVTIDGVTYYPAVDVLGNLVASVNTGEKGSYSFSNLGAGRYFVVFSDTDGYQVARKINPSAWEYSNSVMPFARLSVTPDRDTNVYTKPNTATDKAVPNYNGVSDSSTDGPAPLYNAIITNGGGGIELPALDKIQAAHYVTSRWNCGFYYIDLSLEKQWENTRIIDQGTSVTLDVTGTITGKNDASSAGTYPVTYDAVSYVLTQNSAYTLQQTNGRKDVVVSTPRGVTIPPNVPAKATVSGTGMTTVWTVANQCLQAQGAGPKGEGAEIVYSFTETAKDAQGNPLDGFITELSEVTAQSLAKTFTAKNTQILYDFRIAKVSSTGEGSERPALKDAQYTLYMNEACTEKVNSQITGSQTSGEDGWFGFDSLEGGTWYLKETKAPSGYLLSQAVFKIQIGYKGDPAITPEIKIWQITDAVTGETLADPIELTGLIIPAEDTQSQPNADSGDNTGSVIQPDTDSENAADSLEIPDSGKFIVTSEKKDVTESGEMTKYTITFSVEDECIYALPATGGAGIWWNTLAGVALMLGALFVLTAGKRRKAEGE